MQKAIIERRKSAMKGPTSDFEHIPGSRRTSALPPPPQQSPFKKIGKGIDDGEETTAVLARMQETLDDMRTKKSSAKQGSPGIGRGQGFLSSPAKPAFSLLARGASPRMRSPVFTRETRQTPILKTSTRKTLTKAETWIARWVVTSLVITSRKAPRKHLGSTVYGTYFVSQLSRHPVLPRHAGAVRED